MSDTLTIEAIKEMRRLISLEGGHDPYTLQVFDLAIAQHAEIERMRPVVDAALTKDFSKVIAATMKYEKAEPTVIDKDLDSWGPSS